MQYKIFFIFFLIIFLFNLCSTKNNYEYSQSKKSHVKKSLDFSEQIKYYYNNITVIPVNKIKLKYSKDLKKQSVLEIEYEKWKSIFSNKYLYSDLYGKTKIKILKPELVVKSDNKTIDTNKSPVAFILGKIRITSEIMGLCILEEGIYSTTRIIIYPIDSKGKIWPGLEVADEYGDASDIIIKSSRISYDKEKKIVIITKISYQKEDYIQFLKKDFGVGKKCPPINLIDCLQRITVSEKIKEFVWSFDSNIGFIIPESLKPSGKYNSFYSAFENPEKVHELILTEKNIKQIPIEIKILSNLQILELNSNKLSKIPFTSMKNLNKIKLLDMSYNKLDFISPIIGMFTKLEQLILSVNHFKILPPEIGNLTNLKTLFFTSNGLTKLPPEIGKLANLEKMYLNINCLEELPPEIGKLINLKKLYLCANKLKELPTEISNLVNLQELDLAFNKLTYIPNNITKLKKLKYLNLRGNNLSEKEIDKIKNILPQCRILFYKTYCNIQNALRDPTKVRKLFLNNSSLNSYPLNINKLHNLQELSLSENELTVLSNKIGKLLRLKNLLLDGNKLITLPIEIGNLGNLQELSLGSNELIMLPKTIGKLKKLKKLILHSNKLSQIPKEIRELAKLEYLDLAYNKITKLPLTIRSLINLKYLDLKDNPLNQEEKKTIKKLLPNCEIIF